MVLPTRRRTPRKIDAAIKREESDKPENPEMENTPQFNVYGIPAISVPCGFTSSGLPVGLMIAGPRFSEGRVLALATPTSGPPMAQTKAPAEPRRPFRSWLRRTKTKTTRNNRDRHTDHRVTGSESCSVP